MKNKSESGQAMIEFLVCAFGFVMIFTLLLSLAWLVLTNYLIQSQMQTGLICLTSQPTQVCHYRLHQQLERIILWGTFKNIRSESQLGVIRLRLDYKLQNKIGLHFEKAFFSELQL